MTRALRLLAIAALICGCGSEGAGGGKGGASGGQAGATGGAGHSGGASGGGGAAGAAGAGGGTAGAGGGTAGGSAAGAAGSGQAGRGGAGGGTAGGGGPGGTQATPIGSCLLGPAGSPTSCEEFYDTSPDLTPALCAQEGGAWTAGARCPRDGGFVCCPTTPNITFCAPPPNPCL